MILSILITLKYIIIILTAAIYAILQVTQSNLRNNIGDSMGIKFE